MNRQLAEQIADAVLYEGYMLYPYRPSAMKNRQRWSFGTLYPPAYEEVPRGIERSVMRTECLLIATDEASIHVQLRFLQLISADNHPQQSWDEGVPQSIEFDFTNLTEAPFTHHFGDGCPVLTSFARAGSCVGTITCCAQKLRESVFKLTIEVSNDSPLSSDPADRNRALLRSLLSAHVILAATKAEFVSLLDPPDALKDLVSTCNNVGNFPVLVGDPGERDMLLCSPIVLYDYPQVAPESAGDFYDATEMDEMLTLRVMTLTDDEKKEMAGAGGRVRELLQRTEATAREQLMKTHGVIRNLRPMNDHD